MYAKGNFSIGKFQMKPSFALMLERDADASCRLEYPGLFQTGATGRETRILRIERLKSPRYQIEYFAVFLRLMDKRFPALRREPERMVRVFASAYNSGYAKSLEKLEELSVMCYFPYGSLGIREQYSYCDIAAAYYRDIMRPGYPNGE
jgi:hypothetical protein